MASGPLGSELDNEAHPVADPGIGNRMESFSEHFDADQVASPSGPVLPEPAPEPSEIASFGELLPEEIADVTPDRMIAADETADAADDQSSTQAAARADLLALAARTVATIDRLISSQLDAVLHAPPFLAAEGLWRGIKWLSDTMANDAAVKLRILDVRWSEVARDMERAMSFDESILFEKIYSAEFGSPGGEPYGMVVIDHHLWHRSGMRDRIDDVATLGSLAEVAAAAFCPIIIGVDPRMIGLDHYGEIDLRQDLAASLGTPELKRYDRVRSLPDSRFLGAVLPRVLMRTPYAGRSLPRLGFVYDEVISGPQDLCWAVGGFALAQVAGRAMRTHRWPANIRGALADADAGVVDAPERLFLSADRRGVTVRFPTENAISEEQEVALNGSGFICLRQLHLTGSVAFLNVPSVHRPPEYEGEAAQMNAKMSAMLNYILCVSRFAHYVKVIARDWIGKYAEAWECERLLQAWLNGYVTGNDDASPEMRVRYPLREARVTVADVAGKPGTFSCEIAIRPHYQLDQIASEFRLTTSVGREQGS
jgi:type VI secretion system ImpC/EvpB family protein